MSHTPRRLFSLAAVLLTAILLIGAAVPVAAEVAPAPAAITLTPEATVINMGDYMSLTGTVTDAQGLPVAGAAVQFTSDFSPIIDPNPVYTGVDGTYTVRYKAPYISGTDTVKAQVVDSSVSASASIQVVIVGPAFSLHLALSRQSVAPSETVTLTGRVTDGMGNGIGHQFVLFSATAGEFAAPSVVSGVDGSFAVTYTAPADTSGEIILSAACGWAREQITLRNGLKVVATPAKITLVPEAAVIGFFDYMMVTGQVTDREGLPMAGIPVSLSATYGGQFMPDTAYTDADGFYRAQYTTGPVVGPNTLTAQVPGTAVAASATVQVVMVGLPSNFNLTAAEKFVTKSGSIVITGKVTDANGTGLGHRTVKLTATEGYFTEQYVQTAIDGTFTTVYLAPASVGAVTVTASVPGLPASGSFKLHVTPLDHPEHPAH